MQKMLGYTLNELRQMTWAELTHPDDLDADVKQFERMLAGEIDNYTLDKRFIRKDNEIVYANITVACTRDETDNVLDVLASFLDITARKRMEEDLRRNLEELERFNKLAMGRELKMIHLKEEINELLSHSNRDKRYKIVK